MPGIKGPGSIVLRSDRDDGSLGKSVCERERERVCVRESLCVCESASVCVCV